MLTVPTRRQAGALDLDRVAPAEAEELAARVQELESQVLDRAYTEVHLDHLEASSSTCKMNLLPTCHVGIGLPAAV